MATHPIENIIQVYPNYGEDASRSLPDGQLSTVNFTSDKIQTMVNNGAGELVIFFKDGGSLTIENYNDLVDAGLTPKTLDGQKLALDNAAGDDATTLGNNDAELSAPSQSNQANNDNKGDGADDQSVAAVPMIDSENVTIIEKPDAETAASYQIRSGEQYKFNAPLENAFVEMTPAGSLVIRFPDGSVLLLQDYASKAGSGNPPILIGSGGELFDTALLAGVAKDGFLLGVKEIIMDSAQFADLPMKNNVDVEAFDIADLEPAAGDEDKDQTAAGQGEQYANASMVEVARDFAEIEPAAGESGSSGDRGGYGFESNFSSSDLDARGPIGPIGETELTRNNFDLDEPLFIDDGDTPSSSSPNRPPPPEIFVGDPSISNDVFIVKEDGSIAVPFDAINNGDSSVFLSVIVKNIPAGWGVDPGSGLYNAASGTITYIAGTGGTDISDTIILSPPADSDGDIPKLFFKAVATDADTGRQSSDKETSYVLTDAVADVPNVSASSPGGEEGDAIPLNISGSLNDTDGSEVLSYRIEGVPTDAPLSAGTNLGGGVWELTANQINGLTINPRDGYTSDITLKIVAVSTETNLSGQEYDTSDNVAENEVTLVVSVDDDDEPIITTPNEGKVDETDLDVGNQTTSGTVQVDFGSDTPGTIDPNGSFSSSVTNLTSNGVDIVVTSNGNNYFGKANGVDVFRLQLNNGGKYTFTLYEALDHPDDTDPDDEIILNFGFDAKDSDGDVASSIIEITVSDDGPSGSNDAKFVNEGDLANGDIVETGQLTVDFGEDGPWGVIANGKFIAMDDTDPNTPALNLASGGHDVVVNRVGNAYIGTANGQTIFRLDIDSTTGEYTYTQYQALDDSPYSQIISLNFYVDVIDYDGDVVERFIEIDVLDTGNTSPTAVDDFDSTDLNQSVTVNALANDFDPENDPIAITVVDIPSNGTVVNNFDGTITYTPNNGFTGVDTFEYTITDFNGGTDTATVTITVADVNNPPNAVNDSYSTDEDTSVSFNVLTNDSDPDGDTITVLTITSPVNGNVSFNANGTMTYTPAPDFNGVDTFTYAITDGNGGTDTATVTITVVDVNDPPVAVNDSYTGDEDTQITGNVLTNDSDPDGDFIFVTGVTSQPSNGSVTINPNGNFTYTPNQDFFGTDTFVYQITDGNGGFDTATVTLTVNDVPDNAPPNAVNDSSSTDENTPVTISVLNNDSDPDNDTLTVTSTSNPSNGSVTINNNGTITYTPDNGFSGVDSFTYTITDGNGGFDSAKVTVTVDDVDDTPVIVNAQNAVDETNLGNVPGNPIDASGNVTANFFGDGPGTFAGTGSFSASGNYGGTLQAAGENVTVSYTANNNTGVYTYTGTAGGHTIFEMVIESDGSYTYEQYCAMDHSNTGASNESMFLDFGVEAEDSDGDTDEGTIRIRVRDDAPIANDDNVTVNGAVRVDSLTNNDYSGADVPASILDFRIDNITGDGWGYQGTPSFTNITQSTTISYGDWNDAGDTISTTIGDIQIEENGVFTFTNDSAFRGEMTITYRYQDADGDIDTAVFTLNDITGVDNCPLVFDLDGDGIELVAKEDGVSFDIDEDGQLDQTAWVAADDAILVTDSNNDGIINDHSEMFGGEDGGFADLAQHDTNGDGMITQADAIWQDLQLWQDVNQDGFSQAEELLTLDQAGFQSILLATEQVFDTVEGNAITSSGVATIADGSFVNGYDVRFQYDSGEGEDASNVINLSEVLETKDADQNAIDDYIIQTHVENDPTGAQSDGGNSNVITLNQSGVTLDDVVEDNNLLAA